MAYYPLNPNGQATMANSSPVVIASNQSSVPVTATIAAAQTIAVTNAGTFAVQAAQSGTWNIATVTAVTAITNALPAGTNVIGHVITDTGSTTAVTGTVTISGSVTANAGTNLNTSALALESGGNLATIASTVVSQGTALGSTKVLLAAGSVTTNAPTFTTGQINQFSLTTAGGLRVDLKDSASNTNNFNVNLAASAATVTVTATNLSTNIAQVAGATAQSGSGTATGALRVELPTNGTGVIATVSTVTTLTTLTGTTTLTPGTGATNLGKAEDGAHTSGDVGVFVLGVRNDNLATTYGADQDYGPFATDKNGRVMVAQKAATGTLSNVSSSATNVTLLAANSSRVGAQLYNDSTQSCYVKFGTTASSTSFTVLLATNTYYEVPCGYTGIIDGIWASANGNMRVTEVT